MDILSPPPAPQKAFKSPEDAWAYVAELYHRNTAFIREHLIGLSKGVVPKGRVRAFYPEVQVTSRSYGKTDSTLRLWLPPHARRLPHDDHRAGPVQGLSASSSSR